MRGGPERLLAASYVQEKLPGTELFTRSDGGRRPGTARRPIGQACRTSDRRVQFNTGQRELTLKIVYYGPGLSGKTTNLRALYQRIQPQLRGHLMTLDTAEIGRASCRERV